METPTCAKIHAAIYRQVRALGLLKGMTILDAPCGSGEVALELSKDGFQIFGSDLVDELSPEARSVLGENFRLTDFNQKLPWGDASFDAIISAEGVEHLENPFSFVRELHRICKPGGALIVTTPNVTALRSRMRFFFSGFYNCDPRPLDETARHPLHHIGLRTFPEWRYLLQMSGFELVEASATHRKAISYAYLIFAPLMQLYTRIAFRKEKSPKQRERNKVIRSTLTSSDLLLGENLLLVARKR
jgi:SAM-dependent methyltransferase